VHIAFYTSSKSYIKCTNITSGLNTIWFKRAYKG